MGRLSKNLEHHRDEDDDEKASKDSKEKDRKDGEEAEKEKKKQKKKDAKEKEYEVYADSRMGKSGDSNNKYEDAPRTLQLLNKGLDGKITRENLRAKRETLEAMDGIHLSDKEETARIKLHHGGKLSKYEIVEFIQEHVEILTAQRLMKIVPRIPEAQAYRIIRTALHDLESATDNIYGNDIAVACTLERL